MLDVASHEHQGNCDTTPANTDHQMVPVYIPASCSNIQGDTYWITVMARFEQSKRHLWGLLSFSYALSSVITRKCLLCMHSYSQHY
jgi:hypothetical protein